jgi:hypothetical protein
MKKFKDILSEQSYSGNLGFEEMVKFYNEASPKQIKQMEKIIKSGDVSKFKKLIQNVINVKLEMTVSADGAVDDYKPKLRMEKRTKCPECFKDLIIKWE